MKELSIAGKATRYDEALKEAVIAHKDEDRHLKATLERIFPELKESEDDMTRKEIMHHIEFGGSHNIIPHQRAKLWIAWLEKQGEHANFRNKIQIGDKVTRNEDGVLVNLSQLNRVAKKDEKQGEQKPAEWSEEDETGLTNTIIMLKEGASLHFAKDDITKAVDFLKSLKDRVQPQPKQSLDEDTQQWVDAMIKDYEGWCDTDKNHKATIETKISILKSLRPQSTWKPSKEQMKALNTCIMQGEISYVGQGTELQSLYNDLKKLTK